MWNIFEQQFKSLNASWNIAQLFISVSLAASVRNGIKKGEKCTLTPESAVMKPEENSERTHLDGPAVEDV